MDDPRLWNCARVGFWLKENGFEKYLNLFEKCEINGKTLISLNEQNLKLSPLNINVESDIVRLNFLIQQLQSKCNASANDNTIVDNELTAKCVHEAIPHVFVELSESETSFDTDQEKEEFLSQYDDNKHQVIQSNRIYAELRKTALAILLTISTHFLTSVAIVHAQEKLPDKKTYPPLPDIYLDNFAVIPWAYKISETVILSLFVIWGFVLFFHKHRLILLRRMLVLGSTVYLIRCVCISVTNLPMPERYYKCDRMIFPDFTSKLKRILEVYSGMGMKVVGMKTCGDYMFSGHTVTITLLTHCIIEYTPKKRQYLHIALCLFSLTGLWAILAGHGHYTLDIVVAFYISSRLFMYHHAFANNISLMRRGRKRMRIWFPIFYFFEKDCKGVVRNEYGWPLPSLATIQNFIKDNRVDFCLKNYEPFRHS